MRPWLPCLPWVTRRKQAIVVDVACVATVSVITAVLRPPPAPRPAAPRRLAHHVTAAAPPVTVVVRLVTAAAVLATAAAPPVLGALRHQKVTLPRHRKLHPLRHQRIRIRPNSVAPTEPLRSVLKIDSNTRPQFEGGCFLFFQTILREDPTSVKTREVSRASDVGTSIRRHAIAHAVVDCVAAPPQR